MFWDDIDEDISVQSSISDAGSYYFYAAIAFCAAILGLTVLPETKVDKNHFFDINSMNISILIDCIKSVFK